MLLQGGLSGVGWLIEKGRLRETGSLFFLLLGVVGVLAGGLEGTPYIYKKRSLQEM